MQTIPSRELASSISFRIKESYGQRESDNISKELLRHFYGIDRLQLSMNEPINISEEENERLSGIIDRLLEAEPLQHILGSVEFYGLAFKADNRALIPRPETEELVDWIIQDHREEGLTILDIGTGTGCIPITIATHLASASVEAIDISDGALQLAEENAKINEASVLFKKVDILTESLNSTYDIIVSNPPYIPEADKSTMASNVLDYEPGLALFVPDHDPLRFYDRIATLAIESLRPKGTLYFEIHENYGEEVRKLLSDKGFRNIVVKQDLQGKDRMTKATK